MTVINLNNFIPAWDSSGAGQPVYIIGFVGITGSTRVVCADADGLLSLCLVDDVTIDRHQVEGYDVLLTLVIPPAAALDMTIRSRLRRWLRR